MEYTENSFSELKKQKRKEELSMKTLKSNTPKLG